MDLLAYQCARSRRVAAAGRDRGAEARGGQARPRRPAARAGLLGRACARGRGRRGRRPRGRVRRAPDGGRGRPGSRRARGAGVRAERRGHRARGRGSHLPRTTRAGPRAAARGPRTDRRARPLSASTEARGCARLPRPGTESLAALAGVEQERDGSRPGSPNDRALAALARRSRTVRHRGAAAHSALQGHCRLGMEAPSIGDLGPDPELAPRGQHSAFVFSAAPSAFAPRAKSRRGRSSRARCSGAGACSSTWTTCRR